MNNGHSCAGLAGLPPPAFQPPLVDGADDDDFFCGGLAGLVSVCVCVCVCVCVRARVTHHHSFAPTHPRRRT